MLQQSPTNTGVDRTVSTTKVAVDVAMPPTNTERDNDVDLAAPPTNTEGDATTMTMPSSSSQPR